MASLRFNYSGAGRVKSSTYRYNEVLPIPPGEGEILYRKTNSRVNKPIYKSEDLGGSKAEKEQAEAVICPQEENRSQESICPQEESRPLKAIYPQEENRPQEKVVLQRVEEQEKSTPPVEHYDSGSASSKDVSGSVPSEEIKKELPAVTLSESEKLIAGLENYENGLIKISQQLDQGKLFLDQVLFYLDSFSKILDVIKETEQRKLVAPRSSVIVEKENKDTVDQILELLQTPVFQNILRQMIIGLFKKTEEA